jgi:hypothetical protein
MKHFVTLIVFFYACHFGVFGQEESVRNSENHIDSTEIKFKILKDSLSTFKQLIPAVSWNVINKGEIEFVIFSSLLFADNFRNEQGENVELPYLQTHLQSGIQATYGISNDRLNLGLDINTALVDLDYGAGKSPFSLFREKEYPDISTGLVVTSIGPRVRWRPLRKNYNLVIQASTWFPTYGNSGYPAMFGLEQVYGNALLFYNLPINQKLYMFAQVGIQYGFRNSQSSNIFVFPASLFFSYLISQKLIIFGVGNFAQIRSDETTYKNGGTMQMGLGTQYQFSKSYAVNLYYTKELAGKNYYAYDNLSLSLRVLLK